MTTDDIAVADLKRRWRKLDDAIRIGWDGDMRTARESDVVEKGVDSQRIQTVGRGESESVTGDTCRNMGRENRFNRKLIECLSPDRRVGVEASGSRPQVSSR